MGIFLGDTAPSKIFVGDTEVSKVFVGDTKVRPTELPYLCFTAEEANSTIALNKNGTVTSVSIETSTDGETWSDYTFGNTITLTNIGDKVYWRNKSETTTGFSAGTSNYYGFSITGTIAGSGDATYLINKNGTDTLSGTYALCKLFYNCTQLTSAPKLPATTLTNNCYRQTFEGCTNLTTLIELPATTLTNNCYYRMFYGCSKIKLATAQDTEYTQAYTIPFTGTGTTATNALANMFMDTGSTFTGTPTINTTYYTSNTVV